MRPRKDTTHEGNRVSIPCLPSQQYSDKDPTLIVTCIAAVKLLGLIESRLRYRNNETQSNRRSASRLFSDESRGPRGRAGNHRICASGQRHIDRVAAVNIKFQSCVNTYFFLRHYEINLTEFLGIKFNLFTRLVWRPQYF